MRRTVAVLGMLLVVFAGCTSDSGDDASPNPSPAVTQPAATTTPARQPSDDVPDIYGMDLARAVKKLRKRGLTVDLSSLSRFERRYGRSLSEGYIQTHPRVVVLDYTVEDPHTVSIDEVECPQTGC